MSILVDIANRFSPAARASLRDWLPPVLVRALRRRAGVAPEAPPVSTVPSEAAAPVLAPPAIPSDSASDASPPPVSEVLQVIEVADADYLVGDLFRRRFHTPSFPDYPRHFVAFHKTADGGLLPLGYVHYTMWEGCALCGGMVVDDRLYRRVAAPARKAIRTSGGVAELLLRESFARLPSDLVAIWGHVGDKQAEQVDLRVGFRHTDSPHVMVVWRQAGLSEADKAVWVGRVTELGPF